MSRYNEISLSRKKELEQPDELTENLQKMFAFILKHKVRIGFGIGALFLLIVGITTVQYFSRAAEEKASFLLEQGITRYNTLLNEKSPEEACKSIEPDFQSIIGDYSGTISGKFAMLQLANIYYSARKYNDSISLYEKALDSFGNSKLFENLIQIGLGHCYEDKGEYAKAVAYFEKVVMDPNGLAKEQALFHAGRVYGKMGNSAKQAETYQKLAEDHANSIFSDIAKEHVSG